LISDGERGPFRVFVQALFSRRRKQLGRILRTVWGLSADAVADRLRVLAIDPTARPEVIDVSGIVSLFRATPTAVVGSAGSQVDSEP
jgi:16S rRNA A1518/A1519 N6-dimethyltransferase RsmA/KsgA/DIM1 with predicted DNA glycosylase/AP lyase activity